MARTQHSQSVESLISTFVERLFHVIEHHIDVRTRILAAELIEGAVPTRTPSERLIVHPTAITPGARALLEAPTAEEPADAAMDATKQTSAAAPPRRERSRPRGGSSRAARGEPAAAVTPTPEQERRDAELGRLRNLLKPTWQDSASDAAGPLPPPTAAAPLTDPLRLLQDEIQGQALGLAQLPSESCTARIAAWAGRVRLYQETTDNRVAAELLLDKLRVLASAMDAGRIEALTGAWRTKDWPSYIQANEAAAQIRQEAPEPPAKSLPDQNGDPDYRDVWS